MMSSSSSRPSRRGGAAAAAAAIGGGATTGISSSSSTTTTNITAFRPQQVAMGILLFLLLVSQLQMPLLQFQDRGGGGSMENFRAPAVLLQAPAQSATAREYVYADQIKTYMTMLSLKTY